MVILTYRVELLEPVLVTSLKGDPNSAVGLDYLPGSVIRGAVIGRFVRQNGPVDPGNSRHRKLFFDGSTRYLNCYPVDSRGNRALPTPLSWRREKYAENQARVLDFAIEEQESERVWQRLSHPFCALRGGGCQVELVHPKRWLAVHTYRSRRHGRPMERKYVEEGEVPGTLFRYESLAANQALRGVVVCPDQAAADELKSLLEGVHWVGGARTAGYGEIRVSDVREAEESWKEAEGDRGDEEAFETEEREAVPSEDPGTGENRRVVVTLLSDAIVRGVDGQLRPDAETLRQAIVDVAGGSWKLANAYLRPVLVGGFNRKWGLPLPQAWAVGKGSVLVFQVGNQPDLRRLESEGIGERRLDGFGRVAVDWQRCAELTVIVPTESPGSKVTIEDTEARSVAEKMLQRILRSRLDGLVVQRAQQLKGTMKGMPTPTQLSRLRLAIRRELSSSTPSVQEIEKTLGRIEERRTARGQFERARLQNRSLLEWLKSALKAASDKDSFRQLLGIDDRDLPGIGDVEVELKEELRTEYVLRYIDAVLAIAVKKQKQAEGI